MDTPRTLYKITADTPGSEAAGEAAAALAAAYLVFKDDSDKGFASRLLAASRSVLSIFPWNICLVNNTLSNNETVTAKLSALQVCQQLQGILPVVLPLLLLLLRLPGKISLGLEQIIMCAWTHRLSNKL
jgi:hypothetical protein